MSGYKDERKTPFFLPIFVFSLLAVGVCTAFQIGNPEMCLESGLPIYSLAEKKERFEKRLLAEAFWLSDSAPTEEEPPVSTSPETDFPLSNGVTVRAAEEKGYQAFQNIYITNKTDKSLDIKALMQKETALPKGKVPTVLILHTHTTESYAPTEKENYAASENRRTTDLRYTVAAVGEELGKVLKESGFSVIHLNEINDYPSYNGAYSRSLQAAEKALSEHPEISVIIDLHRDALEGEDGSELRTVWESPSGTAAQAMLVMGSDQILSHPNWEKNLAFALKLQTEMLARYPDLARPVHLATHRYNEHLLPHAFILEMGASGNTLEEARKGVRYVGECLAEVLKRESGNF